MTSAQTPAWWQRRSFLAILVLLFAMPLALGAVPSLIDLPAHVARYHIGATLSDSPDLQRYFSFEWRFMPNLGVDILAIGLARWIGLEPAVRIIVALIPAITAAGMIVIARAAHGRLPVTALVALPLAFAYPMTFGFVNACLAVGLAFGTFGLWLWFDGRDRFAAAAGVAALAAPIVLTAHLVGYGVLSLAILGGSIGHGIEAGWPVRRTLIRAALACLPVAWPFVILTLWSTGTAPPASGWLDWQTKSSWLIGLLRDHWAPLDVASAFLIYVAMLLPILFPRRFAYAPRVAVPGFILWALAIVLPTTLITQFASVRLIYIATALTLLAVRPRQTLPSWVALLAIAFIALRLGSVSVSTVQTNRQLDRELQALDHVARGSRVIAFETFKCARAWQPPRLAHLPSFATLRRDAFVNDHFVTSEGQLMGLTRGAPLGPRQMNPIVFLEPCSRWAERPVLRDAIDALPWGQVDYLWLIDVPPALRPARPDLHLIWQQGNSSLYCVSKSGGPLDMPGADKRCRPALPSPPH